MYISNVIDIHTQIYDISEQQHTDKGNFFTCRETNSEDNAFYKKISQSLLHNICRCLLIYIICMYVCRSLSLCACACVCLYPNMKWNERFLCYFTKMRENKIYFCHSHITIRIYSAYNTYPIQIDMNKIFFITKLNTLYSKIWQFMYTSVNGGGVLHICHVHAHSLR